VAPGGLARDADEVPPLPRRPHVPGRLGAAHARERLGVDPDEIDGGHDISLGRPLELAERLAAYAAEIR
jgi:hypothetical protein